MSKQVILVTGASSGFGLMTARALAQAGHTVYASMRETEGRNAPRVAEAAAWSKADGFDLRTVELDVQSDSSTEAGVAQILTDAGCLDVIVHNAGHMVFGPAEAFTPEQFIQQYDVNVLGAQRVNRAALPHMRGRGKGLLVWVGSSSTRGGTPPFDMPEKPGLKSFMPAANFWYNCAAITRCLPSTGWRRDVIRSQDS